MACITSTGEEMPYKLDGRIIVEHGPKPAKDSSMPGDQSRWFDDDQSCAPVEKASELAEYEPIRSRRPGGFSLALLE